ncbi:MAG: asparagine synthase (glutamine-hydrolyzing) [Clostridium sp.]|nr:asparagine synthase (glutamine-hydrolyzing) [Clostridium sp.]
MCGIIAIYDPRTTPASRNILDGLRTLERRGPDDCGVWTGGHAAIGHRRLSIVGTQNGHQPIVSEQTGVAIACNGEFYGYEQLRRKFAPWYRFSTFSDSEILIPLYLRYGALNDRLFENLVGEFAFVLYDIRTDTLYAVRDRFGIKPLCYHYNGNRTVIASKAKAILASGGVEARWDRYALMHTLTMHYQPTDRTMFDGIRQVPPGHMLVCRGEGEPKLVRYWDVDYPAESGSRTVTPEQERRYVNQFSELLVETIRTRMVSDAPVCCHLSGGIDSSTVAGVMSSLQSDPVHCFSITFPGADSEYNEESLAAETASHIGGILHPIEVTPGDILSNLREAVCESEGLAVNGHLSCKMLLNREIRRYGFKVALTGEGADEALAGYPHLRQDIIALLPEDQRRRLTESLYGTNLAIAGTEIAVGDSLDCSAIERRLGFVPSFLRAKAGIGHRIYRYLSPALLDELRSRDFFGELLGNYDIDRRLAGRHPVNQSLYLWIKLTLCNYILSTLGDGCEMAASVEGRLPFLDHRLFEFAARLPVGMKIRDYTNEKYILKEAARPFITDRIRRRQKHPFQAPPLTRFFSTDDFDRLRGELTSADFAGMGIFNPGAVAGLVDRIPKMSVLEQTVAEPVVMLMLTINHMNQSFHL